MEIEQYTLSSQLVNAMIEAIEELPYRQTKELLLVLGQEIQDNIKEHNTPKIIT